MAGEKAFKLKADEELSLYNSTEGADCVKTEGDQDNGW